MRYLMIIFFFYTLVVTTYIPRRNELRKYAAPRRTGGDAAIDLLYRYGW
jgi:hypothetical protein